MGVSTVYCKTKQRNASASEWRARARAKHDRNFARDVSRLVGACRRRRIVASRARRGKLKNRGARVIEANRIGAHQARAAAATESGVAPAADADADAERRLLRRATQTPNTTTSSSTRHAPPATPPPISAGSIDLAPLAVASVVGDSAGDGVDARNAVVCDASSGANVGAGSAVSVTPPSSEVLAGSIAVVGGANAIDDVGLGVGVSLDVGVGCAGRQLQHDESKKARRINKKGERGKRKQ
jgi:hypothetical protein